MRCGDPRRPRRLDHAGVRRAPTPACTTSAGHSSVETLRRRRARRRALRRAHRRLLRRRVDVPHGDRRLKVALDGARRLAARRPAPTLLDVQWTTPHLRSLGAVDVPAATYLARLAEAVGTAVSTDRERRARLARHDRAASATQPWMMRTYSGHSTAAASNELYRTNLAKGQTGLSIAFDLPTQTGYDPDSPMARGEVGKVGVPVAHLGHMRTLLDGIPPGEMNTSMTINATAAWLLGALRRQRRGARRRRRPSCAARPRTTSSRSTCRRGTYIFPPEPSRRLIVDMVAWCARARAEVEPDERLLVPPAGGRGDAGAGDRLLAGHRHRRARRGARLGPGRRRAVRRRCSARSRSSSTPASASSRRSARCGPSPSCGTASAVERYGVTDAKARRFRYGVQVNSLGLTEAQPENNVQRIVLEMLGVTLSKRARARCVQLPAWNEALGLPRPWDQQWSLRMQQVLAFETDLLEYDDIFDGSHVIEARTAELRRRGAGRARRRARAGRRVRGHRRAEGPARARRWPSAPGASSPATRSSSASTRSPRPTPSPLGGDGSILKVDPGRRGRADRRRAGVAGGPRRRRGRAPRSTSCAGPPTSDENVMPAIDRPGHGRRHHRRVGRRAARGVRRVPRPRPASARRVGRRRGGLAAVAERVKAIAGGPPQVPGRQARPRRPLQRRRADRRRRPRRRHGGHLLGHPPHARADRRRRPATRTST